MNVDEYGFPIFDEDFDNPEVHVPEDIKEFCNNNQVKMIKEWCGEPTDVPLEEIDHPKGVVDKPKTRLQSLF